MGRIVHAWVAVEDEVLISCYQNTCHSWQWANGFHRHLNTKLLPLHLLITRKNIEPVNLLPLFSFTYHFSTLTQVTLDPSLLPFPTHLPIATSRLYLLVSSTQRRYTCSTLSMTKPKNRAKLRAISAGLLVMSGNIGLRMQDLCF